MDIFTPLSPAQKADFQRRYLAYLRGRDGEPQWQSHTFSIREAFSAARANRPDLFNLRFKKVEPFVERYLRFEVRERVSHKGDVLVPLERDDVVAAAEAARRAGAECIAICFLLTCAC